jgi:hypothetical protein
MSLEAFGALVKLLYGNNSYNYSKYGYTSSQEPIEAESLLQLNFAGLPGAHILTRRMFILAVLVQFMLTGSVSFMLLTHVIC